MSIFDLTGRVAVVTGGAGLLGVRHAEAIAEHGGIPVLLDLRAEAAAEAARGITERCDVQALGLGADITSEPDLRAALEQILATFGRVDILINNAANNPTADDVETGAGATRLESMPLEMWNTDLAVGLTGAFLCARVFGAEMARCGGGVILNVASDLGVIAPDQRIYRREGAPDDEQPVKPVTYSVVKTGLIGLTRYLATYWADRGVRANSISPGGVLAGQDEAFVARLSQLIPLARMASVDEYKGAIVFLVSDASSYMTGANLVVDGGRSAW